MHALVPGDTTALMYIDGTSLNKKLEKQDHSKARVMCDRYALGCELWAITYGHHIRLLSTNQFVLTTVVTMHSHRSYDTLQL